MPQGMQRHKENTTQICGSRQDQSLSWRVEWVFHMPGADPPAVRLSNDRVPDATTLLDGLKQYLSKQPVREQWCQVIAFVAALSWCSGNSLLTNPRLSVVWCCAGGGGAGRDRN